MSSALNHIRATTSTGVVRIDGRIVTRIGGDHEATPPTQSRLSWGGSCSPSGCYVTIVCSAQGNAKTLESEGTRSVYLSAILAVVVVAIAIYLLWPVKAIEPRCERGATTAVILVHGFWSNAATWDRLLKLLNADTEFGNAYCFARFEYSSP